MEPTNFFFLGVTIDAEKMFDMAKWVGRIQTVGRMDEERLCRLDEVEG